MVNQLFTIFTVRFSALDNGEDNTISFLFREKMAENFESTEIRISNDSNTLQWKYPDHQFCREGWTRISHYFVCDLIKDSTYDWLLYSALYAMSELKIAVSARCAVVRESCYDILEIAQNKLRRGNREKKTTNKKFTLLKTPKKSFLRLSGYGDFFSSPGKLEISNSLIFAQLNSLIWRFIKTKKDHVTKGSRGISYIRTKLRFAFVKIWWNVK